MGKATLDLPDPLQSPPPGTQTSTDDLLAQLAGEEIDRLLSEAEGAEAIAPATVPSALRTSAPVIPDEPARDPPAGNVAVNIDPGAPAPPEPDEDVAAELDELFNTAVAKDKADEEAAAAVQAVEARAAAPAGAGVDTSAIETSSAERAGLTVSVGATAIGGAGTAAAPQRAPALSAGDRPTPPYLRPLEWLNAPLATCPAPVRDLVGKVAIITLFNAAAIIVYVLLFRRG